MKLLISILTLSMVSCTLMKKQSSDDELQNMGESVLKHKQGLEIDFKPITVEK